MTISIPDKIKNVLFVPKDITNLEELKDLDITHIKGIGKKTSSILNKVLNISKISELANRQIKHDEILKLKTQGIRKYRYSKWVYISKMIDESKPEEAAEPRKISIVGLENAGKTTILNLLQDNVKIDLLLKIPPTLGVNRVAFDKLDTQYIFWDMGGQIQFRKEYLENSEKYFSNIDLLIFVIDIQDRGKYNGALTYLKKVLEILKKLNENPEFLIIINKVDPDIKDNEEIRNSIKSLNYKFKDLFQKSDFKFEVTTYSIYNYLGANRNIISEIREVLKTSSEDEEKTKLLGSSIERVLNIVINLSAVIEKRFTNMEILIENLRQWIEYIRSTIATKHAVVPKEENVKKLKPMGQVKTIRSELRNELKSVLRLRKTD